MDKETKIFAELEQYGIKLIRDIPKVLGDAMRELYRTQIFRYKRVSEYFSKMFGYFFLREVNEREEKAQRKINHILMIARCLKLTDVISVVDEKRIKDGERDKFFARYPDLKFDDRVEPLLPLIL